MSVLSLTRLSAELRCRALELHDVADRLEASSFTVGWSRRAADAMRHRAARGADQIRASAQRHVAAAEAVDRHAAAVRAGLATVEGALAHAEAFVARLGL